MSILRIAVRPLARQQAAVRQVRALHVENVVDHTIPGKTRSKPIMAAKMAVYITCGFGLPFFAAHYQIKKASGSA